MGAGKTTLGKKLAKALDLHFLDSDQLIEQQQGMSIGKLFAEKGETHFREIERECLNGLFNCDQPFLLATGGGMPCYGNAMQTLNELGTTIYLQRSAKELTQRLLNAKQTRPLIEGMSGEDLHEYITSKLAEREEFYRKAQIILDRTQQDVHSITALFRQLHPSHLNQKS
jgi:shikimate kinase